MRIAINFLKQLQEVFFTTYDPSRRATAVAHSLKEFNNVLKNKMEDYNDKTKIDKLSKLKDQLSEL